MKDRPHLHKCSPEEHKRFYIERTMKYLTEHGLDSLEIYLENLYDQAHLKGQVDEWLRIERSRSAFTDHAPAEEGES